MGHPRFPIQSVTLATAVVTIHSRVYFQPASEPWASPHLWPAVSGCLGRTQRNSLSSKAQIIRKSQQSAGSVWLLGASQFILCWHVAGFGDDISLLSQMWWHTLPSSQDAKGKLKAAGATQWDSVFKESPSRWLEARYSCSGFCSMGSQSLRSTAIKGRHDQLISALGRSVWLLTDCCVLLRGR